MSGSELKIKVRRIIVNRIFITAVLLILQIAWFVLCIAKLSAFSGWISAALRVFSLFIVLYIICKDDNPAYKIVWIILIMLLPIFGGLLYLFAGNKKPSKHMHRRIQATKEKYLKIKQQAKEE